MTDLTGARIWLNVLMQAANGCADNSWEQAQVRAEIFNALRQGEYRICTISLPGKGDIRC